MEVMIFPYVLMLVGIGLLIFLGAALLKTARELKRLNKTLCIELGLDLTRLKAIMESYNGNDN